MSLETRWKIASAACVFAISVIVGWRQFEKPLLNLIPLREVAQGMRLPSPSEYAWNNFDNTLVLTLRVGCPHCENEMDFYEELSTLSRNGALSANLLEVFPDPTDDVSVAMSGRLAGIQRITGFDIRSFHVGGTPTLLLVNSAGVVRQAWVGELRPQEKRQVLKAIGRDAK